MLDTFDFQSSVISLIRHKDQLKNPPLSCCIQNLSYLCGFSAIIQGKCSHNRFSIRRALSSHATTLSNCLFLYIYIYIYIYFKEHFLLTSDYKNCPSRHKCSSYMGLLTFQTEKSCLLAHDQDGYTLPGQFPTRRTKYLQLMSQTKTTSKDLRVHSD